MKTHIITCVLGALGCALITTAEAQTPKIKGRWINNGTGEAITIEEDQMGGYRFFQSDIGEGRISLANSRGANIYVSARGLSCYYSANIIDRNSRMNWRLVTGGQNCLELEFTRAD